MPIHPDHMPAAFAMRSKAVYAPKGCTCQPQAFIHQGCQCGSAARRDHFPLSGTLSSSAPKIVPWCPRCHRNHFGSC